MEPLSERVTPVGACDGCKRRLLQKTELHSDKLIGLDELHRTLPPQRVRQVRDHLASLAPREFAALEKVVRDDALASCLVLSVQLNRLDLLVLDESKGSIYQICNDVVRKDCWCWSLQEASLERRFIVKPSRMPPGAPESDLDGRQLCVLASAARSLFRLGAVSPRQLEEIARRLYASGVEPNLAEMRELMRRDPAALYASDRSLNSAIRAEGVRPPHLGRTGRRARGKS